MPRDGWLQCDRCLLEFAQNIVVGHMCELPKNLYDEINLKLAHRHWLLSCTPFRSIAQPTIHSLQWIAVLGRVQTLWTCLWASKCASYSQKCCWFCGKIDQGSSLLLGHPLLRACESTSYTAWTLESTEGTDTMTTHRAGCCQASESLQCLAWWSLYGGTLCRCAHAVCGTIAGDSLSWKTKQLGSPGPPSDWRPLQLLTANCPPIEHVLLENQTTQPKGWTQQNDIKRPARLLHIV